MRSLIQSFAASGYLTIRWVDTADTEAILAALPGADLLWLESPSNPMLDVAELQVVIPAARKAGVPVRMLAASAVAN